MIRRRLLTILVILQPSNRCFDLNSGYVLLLKVVEPAPLAKGRGQQTLPYNIGSFSNYCLAGIVGRYRYELIYRAVGLPWGPSPDSQCCPVAERSMVAFLKHRNSFKMPHAPTWLTVRYSAAAYCTMCACKRSTIPRDIRNIQRQMTQASLKWIRLSN